jgi:hypothetical protein
MKQKEPTVTVELTGRTLRGFEEHLLKYSDTFLDTPVWLPTGFTAELLEDLIRDVRGE